MEAEAFLARLRAAGTGPAPELPVPLPATIVSGDGRGFDRFAAELSAVEGEAVRVTKTGLTAAIADIARGLTTAVVDADLGDIDGDVRSGLARAGCTILEPSLESAARAELGVTGAVLGMASTGSVLLSAETGAGSTGLLPPTHVAILPEERLVPGLEEVLEALPELSERSSHLVLVTGPSRTSDIEMTTVRGVHGPERVIVVVVA